MGSILREAGSSVRVADSIVNRQLAGHGQIVYSKDLMLVCRISSDVN